MDVSSGSLLSTIQVTCSPENEISISRLITRLVTANALSKCRQPRSWSQIMHNTPHHSHVRIGWIMGAKFPDGGLRDRPYQPKIGPPHSVRHSSCRSCCRFQRGTPIAFRPTATNNSLACYGLLKPGSPFIDPRRRSEAMARTTFVEYIDL
jgi:hypothetical protein